MKSRICVSKWLMPHLVCLLVANVCFAAEVSKTIAVVHSYHKEFRWVEEVNRGIVDYGSGINSFGIKAEPIFKSYDVKYYYMGAKSHPNDDKYLASRGNEIISELEKIRPTATIICDDEALKYVAAPLKQNMQYKFVFLGVNNDPRNYGVVENYESPEYNITGLISEHPFIYSLKLVTEIFPESRGIYVFFDDSMTGRGIHDNLVRHMEKLDESIRRRLKKTVISNDWALWKRTIKENQRRDNIFLFGSFYSLHDNKKLLSEKDVIDWITSNSVVPELTIVSSHISDGLLLSISNPGYVHGYEASHRVALILGGEPVSHIPVDVPSHKAIHVNMERAKQIDATIPVDIIAMSKYFDKLGY